MKHLLTNGIGIVPSQITRSKQVSGNSRGGKLAAAKNLARDPDFYRRIGARGGKKGRTGGFASQEVGEDGLTGPQRARVVGKIGGAVSRRGKKQ